MVLPKYIGTHASNLNIAQSLADNWIGYLLVEQSFNNYLLILIVLI